MKTKIGKWKIIPPSYKDENFEELLKSMSEEVLSEAKLKMDSTQFNHDNHIDEVLKQVKPSIVDQELVDFYVNLLRSVPKKEVKNINLKIWKKIEPHLLTYN